MREFIKTTFKSLCDGEVYLFGSRTDELKKGGDIDLLFVSENIKKEDIRKFRIEFFKKFGEQKLDKDMKEKLLLILNNTQIYAQNLVQK